MTDQSASSLWWEEIQGPRSVRADIYTALCDAKSVTLTGENIPWSRTLRTLISSEIQNNLGIYADEINSSEITDNIEDYLLKRFGKNEDINNYREKIDPPLPEYIKRIGALEKKLIYISKTTQSCYKSFAAFLQSFRPRKAEDGIFLIETSGPVNDITSTNKITVIDVSSRITFYDVLSFSMLLVSKLDIKEIWKQYTAWMVSLLFGDNIELLADIITNVIPQSSTSDYHNIVKEKLADTTKFDKSLWTAQLQILFPVIENLRTFIIEKNLTEIGKTLQAEAEYYCGKRITDPYDAELGFLSYLSAKKQLFSYGINQNIQFLHVCRNLLAHMKYCDVSDIEKIVSLNSQLITAH